MRQRLLLLLVLTTLLCASCQPALVTYEPTPAPTPTPEQTTAELYLSEQRSLFEQEAQQLLQKHLDIYKQRGGRGTVGIYFLELGSGFSVGHEANKTLHLNTGEDIGYFNTASVAKLPMAFVAYALADQGVIDLSEPHYDAVTRRTWDLRPMIYEMLTHSINDYFNILLRMIGPLLAQETLAASGLPDTRLSRELQPAVDATDATSLKRYGTLLAPRTTPADLGQLLAGLYEGKLLTPDSSAEMLDALQETVFNSRIPAGVGYAVPVAHKTGTSPEEQIYNDAALVLLPGNPFVLVVLSKDASSHITRTMRELASDLYAFEKSRVKESTMANIEQALTLTKQQPPAPSAEQDNPLPEYNFQCPICDVQSTIQRSILDVSGVRCPNCGGILGPSLISLA